MTACTQLWNFMYIDDAGRALADLAEYAGNLTDHGCVYNLGGPMDETGPLRGFVETGYELDGRIHRAARCDPGVCQGLFPDGSDPGYPQDGAGGWLEATGIF